MYASFIANIIFYIQEIFFDMPKVNYLLNFLVLALVLFLLTSLINKCKKHLK
jgi:large-conductance mechanosensitive channel